MHDVSDKPALVIDLTLDRPDGFDIFMDVVTRADAELAKSVLAEAADGQPAELSARTKSD